MNPSGPAKQTDTTAWAFADFWFPEAWARMQKYGFCGHPDDAQQELRLSLYRAFRMYEDQRGPEINFSHYAVLYAREVLMAGQSVVELKRGHCVIQYRNWKRDLRVTIAPEAFATIVWAFEDGGYDGVEEGSESERYLHSIAPECLEDYVDVARICEVAETVLTARDQKMLTLRAQDETLLDIGKEVGGRKKARDANGSIIPVSREYARIEILAAERKLREAFERRRMTNESKRLAGERMAELASLGTIVETPTMREKTRERYRRRAVPAGKTAQKILSILSKADRYCAVSELQCAAHGNMKRPDQYVLNTLTHYMENRHFEIGDRIVVVRSAENRVLWRVDDVVGAER